MSLRTVPSGRKRWRADAESHECAVRSGGLGRTPLTPQGNWSRNGVALCDPVLVPLLDLTS